MRKARLLTLTEANKAVIETEREKEANPEEEEEKGLWDFVVDGERALQDITKCTERMAEATQVKGKKMQTRTADV